MSISINKEKCIGCRKCINVCPGSLLKADENNKAYIKYPKDCWGCSSCIKECNKKLFHYILEQILEDVEAGYLLNMKVI